MRTLRVSDELKWEWRVGMWSFLMRMGDGKVWCELLKCGSKKSCTE